MKPLPNTVTFAGLVSSPPYGLRLVTLGSVWPEDSSTYSNSELALGMLDCPLVAATTICAGPAPSSVGLGEVGGVVVSAAGSVTCSVELLMTAKLVAVPPPTDTRATRGDASGAEARAGHRDDSPPAVDPMTG